MGAGEERGQPEQQPVAHDRAAGGAEGEEPEARLADELGADLAPGRVCTRDAAVAAATGGLPDRARQQGSECQPGKAERDERGAPTEAARDVAAKEVSERAAERDAQGIEADCARAAVGGKVVGDQGVSGCDAAGFADPDPEARDKQGREAVRESTHRCEGAPERERRGHDPAPGSGGRRGARPGSRAPYRRGRMRCRRSGRAGYP